MTEAVQQPLPPAGPIPRRAPRRHLTSLAPPNDQPFEPQDEVRLLPETHDDAPWLTGPLERLGRPLREDTFVDVAIVGGGFTGLMCAHALARLRPSWSIMVVDALRVGQSASGRNSGYLMDFGHWHEDWPLETNRAVAELSRLGVDRLHDLVETHRIDCDWFDGGRYHVAVNDRGHQALDRLRRGLQAMGIRHRDVHSRELAERLGTTLYTDGFRVDGGALVNPAKLVRGIAQALPDSVWVAEDVPISRLELGTTHRLRSGEHTIQTPRLVLASNGFLPAMGVQRGRVLPFVTYASITEPLPTTPGSEPEWGVVPEEKMGATVRLTRDNRLVIRNGVRYRSKPRLDAAMCGRLARSHRRSLERRFPQFADVPFSHSWGGTLGVTMNDATVFGRFGPNAWACGAHNGVGMSMGAALGDALAHEIVKLPHAYSDAARAMPQPAWMPPEPFLTLGIGAYTRMLGLLAGDER